MAEVLRTKIDNTNVAIIFYFGETVEYTVLLRFFKTEPHPLYFEE